MAVPMKLALRNRLAGWCLEALRNPAAEARIHALAAFAGRSDASGTARDLDDERAAILAASDVFEPLDRGVRLRPELSGDVEALRWRAPRFSQALSDCRKACAAPRPGEIDVPWSLCAAAALFNARLFFEVHELLEDCWRPAQGPLKTLLQGLIQVAVGLHHHANGNLRGAIALLGEGNVKLSPFRPEIHGVELGAFCAAIDAITGALRGGAASSELPIPRLVVRHSSAITR
jgi:predicted metal-dependent hydrolase